MDKEKARKQLEDFRSRYLRNERLLVKIKLYVGVISRLHKDDPMYDELTLALNNLERMYDEFYYHNKAEIMAIEYRLEVLSSKNPTESLVLRRYYIDGQDSRKIAGDMSLSISRLHQIRSEGVAHYASLD